MNDELKQAKQLLHHECLNQAKERYEGTPYQDVVMQALVDYSNNVYDNYTSHINNLQADIERLKDYSMSLVKTIEDQNSQIRDLDKRFNDNALSKKEQVALSILNGLIAGMPQAHSDWTSRVDDAFVGAAVFMRKIGK